MRLGAGLPGLGLAWLCSSYVAWQTSIASPCLSFLN